MDIRNIVEQACRFIAYIATTNPYAVPFWLAVLWLFILANWQWTVRSVWRSLHLIEDLVLQRQLFAKLEKPLKFLLLILAALPLLHLLPTAVGSVLERVAGLLVPLLSLYLIVTSFDVFFSHGFCRSAKTRTFQQS